MKLHLNREDFAGDIACFVTAIEWILIFAIPPHPPRKQRNFSLVLNFKTCKQVDSQNIGHEL